MCFTGKVPRNWAAATIRFDRVVFFWVPPGTIHEFTTAEESLSMLNFHSPPVFPGHDTFFVELPLFSFLVDIKIKVYLINLFFGFQPFF